MRGTFDSRCADPTVSYAGAHLDRRVFTAGLGGIDPTM